MNSIKIVRLWTILTAVFTLAHCKGDDKKESGGPGTPLTTLPASPGATSAGLPPVSGPAKTKDECNGENNAWIAVVNGGQSPSTCGSPLSAWGCCKNAIVNRFPTLSQDLATRIDQNITDGFQLYNCSSVGDKTHKMHFAKFPGGGKTEYRELSIDAFAYATKTDDGCPKIPQVDFPDPAQYAGGTTTSGTPGPSPSSSAGGGSTNGGSGTNLTFDRDINPIIKSECAGSGCHGTTGAGSVVYEDNESNFKAGSSAIKDRIARAQGTAGVMPPARAMSKADRDSMLEFLNN